MLLCYISFWKSSGACINIVLHTTILQQLQPFKLVKYVFFLSTFSFEVFFIHNTFAAKKYTYRIFIFHIFDILHSSLYSHPSIYAHFILLQRRCYVSASLYIRLRDKSVWNRSCSLLIIILYFGLVLAGLFAIYDKSIREVKGFGAVWCFKRVYIIVVN